MDALLQTARSTCEAMRAVARVSDRIRQQERSRKFKTVVEEAHGLLANHVIEGVEDAILAAAKAGEKEAVVLTFEGNATLADLGIPGADALGQALAELDINAPSLLYVLKGPREKFSKLELCRAGLTPLLDRLRETVHPFALRLDWDELSNVNRLVISGW